MLLTGQSGARAASALAGSVPADTSQHLHLKPASASGYWCVFWGGMGATEENVLRVPAACPARSRCFRHVGPRLLPS